MSNRVLTAEQDIFNTVLEMYQRGDYPPQMIAKIKELLSKYFPSSPILSEQAIREEAEKPYTLVDYINEWAWNVGRFYHTDKPFELAAERMEPPEKVLSDIYLQLWSLVSVIKLTEHKVGLETVQQLAEKFKPKAPFTVSSSEINIEAVVDKYFPDVKNIVKEYYNSNYAHSRAQARKMAQELAALTAHPPVNKND